MSAAPAVNDVASSEMAAAMPVPISLKFIISSPVPCAGESLDRNGAGRTARELTHYWGQASNRTESAGRLDRQLTKTLRSLLNGTHAATVRWSPNLWRTAPFPGAFWG